MPFIHKNTLLVYLPFPSQKGPLLLPIKTKPFHLEIGKSTYGTDCIMFLPSFFMHFFSFLPSFVAASMILGADKQIAPSLNDAGCCWD